MLYLKNKYSNFKYNLSINKLEQIKNNYNKYILSNSSDLSLLKDLFCGFEKEFAILLLVSKLTLDTNFS